MEQRDSKDKRQPKKIDKDDDDVRVILEDQSQESSEDALSYKGISAGLLWTTILQADQRKDKVIAPVSILEDLKLVDSMIQSDPVEPNPSWKLFFDPKVVGHERDPDLYELKYLTMHDLTKYAKIASKARLELLN